MNFKKTYTEELITYMVCQDTPKESLSLGAFLHLLSKHVFRVVF